MLNDFCVIIWSYIYEVLITLKLNCTQNSAWLPVLKYKLHLRIKCMLHAARNQEYGPHLLQKSLLSCGQKDLSRQGRCKRGLEEGDIPRLNNSCPSLPVLLAASSPTPVLQERGCLYPFFPILTVAVCWFPTTSPNPRHPQPISLDLPSSCLPRGQGPPPGTLAEGPCRSPISCPFLCNPFCLILSLCHFHRKISNSLSVVQKPSMAYHQ